MKNKKLMGLLALASCVMLAGCDNGNEGHTHVDESPKDHVCDVCKESKDAEGKLLFAEHKDGNLDGKCDYCGADIPLSEPEKKVEFVNLPEKVEIGEEIDIANFVKLNGTGTFDINFDDASFDVAEIDGTKAVGTKEGLLTFEVSYKGETIIGTVTVISHIRKAFIEAFDGVGYDYAVYEGVFDDETDELIDFEFMAGHNENYVILNHFDYDVDQDGAPGGIINIDGDYYQFSVDENLENPIVSSKMRSASDMEEYNLPVELNDAVFDYDVYKGEEFLICEDESVASAIASGICNLGPLTDGTYNYNPSSVEIDLYEEFDEETGELLSQEFMFIPYFTGHGQTFIYSYYLISLDEEDYVFPELDAILASGEKPAPTDYSAVSTALNSILSSSSYSVSYEFGWVDEKGTSIEAPDISDTDLSLAEDSFVDGEAKITFVKDQGIVKYDLVEGAIANPSGKLFVEGSLYQFQEIESEYQVVEASSSSLDDFGEERFEDLAKPEGVDNSYFPENLCYEFVEDWYSFNVGKVNALMEKFFLANSTLAPIITDFIYYILDNDDYDYSGIFDSYANVSAEGVVTFKFEIYWNIDVLFAINIRFEEVGTAEIPEEIVNAVSSALSAE